MNSRTKRWIVIGIIAVVLLVAIIGVVVLLTKDEPKVPSVNQNGDIVDGEAQPTSSTLHDTGSSNMSNFSSSSLLIGTESMPDGTQGSTASSSSENASTQSNATSSSDANVSSSLSGNTSTQNETTSSIDENTQSSSSTQSGATSSLSSSGGVSTSLTNKTEPIDSSTTSGGVQSTNGASNTSSTNATSVSSSTATSTSNTTRSTTTIPTTQSTSRPTSITLPTQKDPETGEVGITFPCAIPGYDLVIEKLAPYKGLFVEDGSNRQVDEVAMILLRNTGDQPLEFAQIVVNYDDGELLFEASAIPAGACAVVQEKTGKYVPLGKPKSSTALVAHRPSLEMSSDQVAVKDNGNNTLTIQNLTNQSISSVRVFYKYYIEDQDVFVGGIAFSMRLTRLGAFASITVQPAHYTSQSGRVVMVLTYEE